MKAHICKFGHCSCMGSGENLTLKTTNKNKCKSECKQIPDYTAVVFRNFPWKGGIVCLRRKKHFGVEIHQKQSNTIYSIVRFKFDLILLDVTKCKNKKFLSNRLSDPSHFRNITG